MIDILLKYYDIFYSFYTIDFWILQYTILKPIIEFFLWYSGVWFFLYESSWHSILGLMLFFVCIILFDVGMFYLGKIFFKQQKPNLSKKDYFMVNIFLIYFRFIPFIGYFWWFLAWKIYSLSFRKVIKKIILGASLRILFFGFFYLAIFFTDFIGKNMRLMESIGEDAYFNIITVLSFSIFPSFLIIIGFLFLLKKYYSFKLKK